MNEEARQAAEQAWTRAIAVVMSVVRFPKLRTHLIREMRKEQDRHAPPEEQERIPT